jgi:peptidase E
VAKKGVVVFDIETDGRKTGTKSNLPPKVQPAKGGFQALGLAPWVPRRHETSGRPQIFLNEHLSAHYSFLKVVTDPESDSPI